MSAICAVRGLVAEMNNVLDKDKQPEMMDKFNKGIFTLRDMYEQFQVRRPFCIVLYNIVP